MLKFADFLKVNMLCILSTAWEICGHFSSAYQLKYWGI